MKIQVPTLLSPPTINLSGMPNLITLGLALFLSTLLAPQSALSNDTGNDKAIQPNAEISVRNGFHFPFCFRLQEHLDDALVLESGQVSDSTDSSISIWPHSGPVDIVAYSPDASVVEQDDLLKLTTTGPGSLIISEEMSLYSPAIDSIVFKMKISGATEIKVEWRYRLFAWDELSDCFLKLPADASEEFQTYVIQMDNIDSWQQYRIVDGLKVASEGPAAIEIERVEMRKRKRLFAAAGIGAQEYATDGDTRPVVFMHPPAKAVFRLTLPEKPFFESGITVVEHQNPVTFRLTVSMDGEETTLLEETINDPSLWFNKKIDLAAFAGKTVELEFGAVGAEPGQVALWSNPCIYQAEPAQASQRAPNILLYLVDALRADRLSAYGYSLDTSPRLSALAQSGALFTNFFSQETCTKPSVMTLHTGTDKMVHGFSCNGGPDFEEELPFFPATLRSLGYTTCAISENSYAPPRSFVQTAYCRQVELFTQEANMSEHTYTHAVNFLEQHRDRPFFLYIHTMECHGQRLPEPGSIPHTPSPPLDNTWNHPHEATLPEKYDGSIAYADYNLGRVLDKIDDLGLRDNLLVIFIADHGYALGERDEWAHGHDPYDDQIHVPLIIKGPENLVPTGAVVTDYVKMADISATLLDLFGQEKPLINQGNSLFPLLQGNRNGFPDRLIISFNGWLRAAASVIRNQWKLLRTSKESDLLFSMNEGINETEDLSTLFPDIVEELRQELRNHLRTQEQKAKDYQAAPGRKEEVLMDPVKLEILKSLGYIGN